MLAVYKLAQDSTHETTQDCTNCALFQCMGVDQEIENDLWSFCDLFEYDTL